MMASYYSPFPREKSNNEVLKRSYAKVVDDKKTLIDIPPTVTVSYMKKNPYYFDLKKSVRVANKKRPITTKETKRKSYTIYDNKKLESLLRNGKDVYIAPRPKLNGGCEVIESKIKTNGLSLEDRKKLTSKDILKIINKIKIPMEDEKQKMGKVPKYINEFKIRDFIEKEYERLVEEEKGYPKGTFKVWEGDRIAILHNLNIVKEDLTNQLMKFPVDYYLRSCKIKNARAAVEKRLNEIDYAIRIFQLTDVFLKL